MKKVYCKDCYWLRSFRSLSYHDDCSLDKCFKGGLKERDTPFSRIIVDTTRRVESIYTLNKNNDCPDFRKATFWEKIKKALWS